MVEVEVLEREDDLRDEEPGLVLLEPAARLDEVPEEVAPVAEREHHVQVGIVLEVLDEVAEEGEADRGEDPLFRERVCNLDNISYS